MSEGLGQPRTCLRHISDRFSFCKRRLVAEECCRSLLTRPEEDSWQACWVRGTEVQGVGRGWQVAGAEAAAERRGQTGSGGPSRSAAPGTGHIHLDPGTARAQQGPPTSPQGPACCGAACQALGSIRPPGWSSGSCGASGLASSAHKSPRHTRATWGSPPEAAVGPGTL